MSYTRQEIADLVGAGRILPGRISIRPDPRQEQQRRQQRARQQPARRHRQTPGRSYRGQPTARRTSSVSSVSSAMPARSSGYHTGVIRSGFPGYTVITPSPSRTRETASTAAPRQQSRYRSPAKLPIESAGEGTTTAATPFQHPTEGSGRQAVAATPPRFAKPYRTGIIKSNGKGRTKVIMVAGDESSGARGGSSGAGAGRAQRREPYRSSTIRWKGNGATSAGFTSPEKWPTPRGTAGIPMPISRPAEGVAPY